MGKGGGKQTQTTTNEPWKEAQPFLKDVYGEAQKLYQKGAPQFWQGTAGAGLTPEMQAALGNIWSRASTGSPLMDAAQASTGAVAGGGMVGSNPAYSYLEQLMGGNNPAMGMAGDLAASTMGGTNPALEYMQREASGANVGNNPWLDKTFGQAATQIRDNFTKTTVPALQSDYAQAGRYGSNALSTALGQAKGTVDTQVGDLATKIYGGAYDADRNRQQAAMGQLGSTYAQDIASKIGAGNFLSGIYDADVGRKMYGAQQIGQLGQQDITNMLSAAGMAPGMQAADYADLDRQLQVGQYQQGRSQAELDLERQRFDYGQQSPYNWLSQYANLIYGNPGSSGYGTNTQTVKGGGGNLFGDILGGIGTAVKIGSMFSDRKLKKDVKKVGRLDNNLPVYSFRYKFGGPTMLGLMAQDVEKVEPEAVATDIWSGFKMVDYDKAVSHGHLR